MIESRTTVRYEGITRLIDDEYASWWRCVAKWSMLAKSYMHSTRGVQGGTELASRA